MANRWDNYDPLDAFWANVDKSGDHWLWTGTKDKDGYGVFGSRVLQRKGWGKRAHKIAWLASGLEIPENMVLDHKCRVRLCVWPKDLEPVTSIENTMRGLGPAVINALKTHCLKGHEFTPDNTYIYTKEKHGRNKRVCRTCALTKH